MTTSRIYRVALVGCGDIAETGHLPALIHHPRFKLVACCDRREDRAQLLARRVGDVEFVNDHRVLLSRERIDAVVLALHPQVSVDVAGDFLRAGIPVLDEKPLATNVDEAMRLKAVIDETRVIYQIGFVFSYAQQVSQIAAHMQDIGSPHLIRVSVFDERLDRANVNHLERIQSILRASSAITHEGSHVVDFVKRWNAAPYVRVSAAAMKTQPEFDGPNVWSTRFDMADGSMLALDVGWLLPSYRPSEIIIQGPRGVLRVEPFVGGGELLSDGATRSLSLPPLTQDWAAQLDAFATSLDAGRSIACPFERGLDALRATQACEASARTGQTVSLE